MKKLTAVASTALVLSSAFAASNQDVLAPEEHLITPLEICIASPIQLPSASWVVDGIRFSMFYGDSYELNGIDFGLVGRTRQEFRGVSLNAFNWNDMDVSGIQLGALANIVHGSAYGIQFGGFINSVQNEMRGVQLGIVNKNGPFYGVQAGILDWNKGISYGGQLSLVNVNVNEFDGATLGFVNWSERCTGFQFGFLNFCTSGAGFQLGVFNAAETFDGLQIGLINIIQKGDMPIMCIANANF